MNLTAPSAADVVRAPAAESSDRPPRRTTGPGRGRWWVRVGAGLLLPVGLLVTWQLVAAAGVYSTAQLPPPGDVVLALR